MNVPVQELFVTYLQVTSVSAVVAIVRFLLNQQSSGIRAYS